MNKPLQRLLVLCLASAAGVNVSLAQPYPVVVPNNYGQVLVAYSQADLDGMLAPIALYPDSLLAQILMAATYPAEVTEAARWSRSIPGVSAQEAVRSAARRGWDASVQSLLAFPQVLDLLDRYPEWTQRLGNAFLAQQEQIWGTVQALRQRAYAAGQLRSTEQLRVLFNGSTIVLDNAQPDVVYVPYYDPLVVYGNWWWPGYAPMRWNPWPGYVVRRSYDRDHRERPIYMGNGIQVGIGFFFGAINWNNNRVTVHRPEPGRERPDWRRPGGEEWRHEPEHRRDAPYVNPQPAPRPQPNVRPPQPVRPAPPPALQQPQAPLPEQRPDHRPRQTNPPVHVEPQTPPPLAPKPEMRNRIDRPEVRNAPVATPAAPPVTAAPQAQPPKVERREPMSGPRPNPGGEAREQPREQPRPRAEGER